MGYFPAITGLRILAAALVFAHHYFHAVGGPQGPWRIFDEGYIGVTIFFTLSGFLITWIYLQSIAAGKITLREYWLRRFARIYPVYFAILVTKLVFFGGATAGSVASNLTLTQSFFERYLWSGLAPAWSLTVEECFYLLAPLIFLGLASAGATTRKGLVRAAVILSSVSLMLWLSGHGMQAMDLGWSFMARVRTVEIYTIFGRFTEFAFGIMLALWMNDRASARAKKSVPWRVEGAFLFGMAGLVASMAFLLHLTHSYQSWYGILSPYGIRSLWPASIATVLILWASLNGSRAAGLVLGNRVVEYLGRVSYVLYLLQDDSIFSFINGAVSKWFGASQQFEAGRFFASLVVFLLIAAALYEAIEKPAHRFINRFATPKRPRLKRARGPRAVSRAA